MRTEEFLEGWNACADMVIEKITHNVAKIDQHPCIEMLIERLKRDYYNREVREVE